MSKPRPPLTEHPPLAHMAARTCAQDGCEKRAGRRKRYCSAHHARSWRKRPMSPAVRARHDSPMSRVEAAAVDLGLVTTDDDAGYTLARERLRKAVEAHARAWCAARRHTPDAVAPSSDTPAST